LSGIGTANSAIRPSNRERCVLAPVCGRWREHLNILRCTCRLPDMAIFAGLSSLGCSSPVPSRMRDTAPEAAAKNTVFAMHV